MESQREPHFDWLQEGGPALLSRLQNSVSERNLAKTASADKRKTELYISHYFGNFLPYIYNKSFRRDSLFFLDIQIGSTRSIRFAAL